MGLLAFASTAAPLQPVSLDIENQVYKLGYSKDYDYQVRRNSTGSRVYIYQRGPGRGLIVVEGGRVVRQMQRPGDLAFLNDDEQFVAWTDDLKAGVSFLNGIHLNSHGGLFDVDYGGHYFVIGSGNGETSEIGKVEDPTHPLAVARIEPLRIFAGYEYVYLVGWARDRSLICQTYAVRDGRLAFVNERTVAKPFSDLLDMDPATERIIVTETVVAYAVSVSYVVQLNTGQREFLGLGYRPTLLLQPGVMFGSK
jgi:hypothetical protein